MLTKKELKQLAIDDLKRSGLNISDFKKMKLKVCDFEEAELVLDSSFSTSGYVMPYFDIKGKEINNFRFRFLEELLGKDKKAVRYSQVKGTEPRLYFPPCIKWDNILKDSSITITFTEGEKKAYKACKEGVPTIGLGGVWAFKSKKLQKNLIDDFKDVILSDRKVLICYDNDLQTNEDVLKALRAFAKELNNEGAYPFNKKLPFDPYEKIGLDDFLLTNSLKDYGNLPELEFNNLVQLDELNDEIAYIEELGKVYIFKHNHFTSDKPLVNLIYANKTIPSDTKDGSLVSVASLWLTWHNRRTHKRLTYKPGIPQVTDLNEFNLWKGWGVVPKKGSIKVFTEAVKKVFDNDKELINWFMDWIAYPIQYPGTKMLTAVLMQSIKHGTGKGSLAMCIQEMYGENAKIIDNSQLNMPFNEWAINKQFIIGDEILNKDKRGEADKIKNLITRPEITINKKNQPTYTTPDCINYFFTSNHPDPLNLEPDDRRVFVHEIKSGCEISLRQGQELQSFREGQGTSHLLNYFINEHKISKGFDYRARPPMTASKMELIDHSLTDVERFLTELKLNPNEMLTISGVPIDRDLFSTTQIAHIFDAHVNNNKKISITAIGKALKKIFYDSEILTFHSKRKGIQNVRALRNIEKWSKADNKKMAAHYDKSKIAMLGVTRKNKAAK